MDQNQLAKRVVRLLAVTLVTQEVLPLSTRKTVDGVRDRTREAHGLRRGRPPRCTERRTLWWRMIKLTIFLDVMSVSA